MQLHTWSPPFASVKIGGKIETQRLSQEFAGKDGDKDDGGNLIITRVERDQEKIPWILHWRPCTRRICCGMLSERRICVPNLFFTIYSNCCKRKFIKKRNLHHQINRLIIYFRFFPEKDFVGVCGSCLFPHQEFKEINFRARGKFDEKSHLHAKKCLEMCLF